MIEFIELNKKYIRNALAVRYYVDRFAQTCRRQSYAVIHILTIYNLRSFTLTSPYNIVATYAFGYATDVYAKAV